MSKPTQAISKDLGRLADDASALLVATADVAGETIEAARKRLTATAQVRLALLLHRSTSSVNTKVGTTNGVVTVSGMART